MNNTNRQKLPNRKRLKIPCQNNGHKKHEHKNKEILHILILTAIRTNLRTGKETTGEFISLPKA